MNNSYKLVYSEALNAWVAVSEHVSARGKKGTVRLLAAVTLLASGALGAGAAQAGPPVVNQLPTGAQVAAGAVAISQTQTATAASMAIAQSSQQAIVNWQSFNVGANAKVNISQPNSASVLLNRVMSSDPSQIFGQINANGQVFLTNPNGVYFAPGASVDVGSFTATTHSISDGDFLKGNYLFSRNGATGSVVNEGGLTAALGGYIALLAPEVRNHGVVLAQMGGTVALAAGESFQLQFNSNNQLTNVLVTPGTLQTLVDNGNAVQAPGGLIILSAQAASNLLGGVVKNSGTLSATGLVNDGGVIRLSASHQIELAPTSRISADAAPGSNGNGGRIEVIADLSNATSSTQVDGTLSAKGGDLGGQGGFVETSAAILSIGETTMVNTGAPKGQSGDWLLDPYDVTIVDSGTASGTAYGTGFTAGATSVILSSSINNSLAAGTSVTISTATSSPGANYTASNYATNISGNIFVNGNISWTTAATLTLTANYNISVGTATTTASITVGGTGILNLKPAGSGDFDNPVYFKIPGQVMMGMASTPTGGLATGHWDGSAFVTGAATGFNGQINVMPTATLKVKDLAYTAISSRSEFEAIANTGNGYFLRGNLDFAGKTYTASAAGDSNKNFEGLGHQISNLTIVQSGANTYGIGLFHSIGNNTNFGNIGVTGSVTTSTAGEVGSLAGVMGNARVHNVYSTASVTATITTGSFTGYASAGGLFGDVWSSYWYPILTNAYATGKVTVNTNASLAVGGLVGLNGSGGQQDIQITNSYAKGDVEVNVSGATSVYVGGLVGQYQTYQGILNNSYATGNVNVTGGTGNAVGGLMGHWAGFYDEGIFSYLYATGSVTNTGTNSRTGGLFGYANGSISNSYATGTVVASGSSGAAGGLVGYLASLNSPTLSYSYASNRVTGPALLNGSGSGALVGVINTNGGSFTLTSNYYDSTKSGQARGIGGTGNGNSPNYYPAYADAANQVSALTTAQLKTASNLPGLTFGSAGFGYAGATNGGLPVICVLSSCTSFITSVVSATYNGVAGGLWSVGTNWIGGVAPITGSSVTEAVVNSGSTVSYDTGTVGSTSAEIQNAGSIVFTGASNVTLSGAVSGTGSLTKTGSSVITLSGGNSYTGGTTISAGVLQAGSATAFGTGAISVTGGALDLNGKALTSTGALSLSGTGVANAGALTNANANATAASFAGAVTLDGASSIGGSGNITLSGGVGGANALTINGGAGQTATVTLTGANSYAGTTITAGTLQIGAGSTSGTLSGDVSNSGVLAFNRSDALTYAGAVSGSGAVTKLGAGTTTLSGNNSYSGGTTVSAGTLQMGAATGAGSGAISVTSGAAFDLNGQTMTSTGGLTLGGTGVSSGGALLNTSSTAATYAGLLTLSAASTIVGGMGTVALSNTGTVVGGGFALTLGGAQGGSIAGILDSTLASVTKQDAGTWMLSGANSYSGANSVSAGTLRAGSATAFGSGTVSVTSGAALDLNGQTMTSPGVLTLRGTGISSAGALLNSNSAGATYAGLVTLGAASSMVGDTGTVALSNTGTVTGATFALTLGGARGGSIASIIGTTSGTLTKQGAGTWLLSGANTYTGLTTVSAGTLAISSVSALGNTSSGTTVSTGAALDLQNVASVAEAITLNGGALSTSTGTSSLNGAVAIGVNSAVNVAGTQLTIAGIVSGGYGLTKSGSGVLVLTRLNTYSGGTIVNAGTLQAGGGYSGLDGPFGPGTVTVSGGTVDLNGTTVNAPFSLGAGGAAGALVNNSATGGAAAFPVSLSANSTIGGVGAGNLLISGAITSNGYGLALLGTNYAILNNTSNTLTTLASGAGVGPMQIINSQAMTIGQVIVGGVTYSGINSMGTVSVQTRSGDLTVSQSVITTSASTNSNQPAIRLSSGSLSAAGTTAGGDLVWVGSPALLMGAGGISSFYSGSATNSNGIALTNFLSSKSSSAIEYNRSIANNPLTSTGYRAMFRESPTVIYLRPASGQSSVYGTAPSALNYCYSSSAIACTAVNYAGIPTTYQSFDLANSAVTSVVNVSGGVSGGLVLSGPASVASGLAASTNAGTYALALKPSLSLSGYVFVAATAVNYTVTPKAVLITDIARTTVYDGLTSYRDLAKGDSATVTGLVGQDALRSLTQTASGAGVVVANVANAGSFTVTPSAAVLSTGTASNYSFTYAPSTHTVAKAALTVTANDDARFVGQVDTVGYSGVSYAGFVANETASRLTGTASVNRGNSATGAGTYTGVLSATGLSSSNYAITYLPGSYTIVPAEQLLVRLVNASTTYGSSASYTKSAVSYLNRTSLSVVDLTVQSNITGNTFTLNDGAGGSTAFTLGALAPALSSSGNTAAGSYQVGATAITNTSANYSNKVTVVGTLEVGKKSLTAAVTSGLSKTYDGTSDMVNPGFALTGLVGEDKVAVTGAVGGYASENAGTSLAYTVTGMSLGGTDAGNYQFASGTSLSGSNGVITPAPLQINASNDSKSYDALAYSGGAGVRYSGLVNGESSSVLSGTLAYGGSAQGATNAGTYSIEPSGLTSSNYAITFGNGALYINPADVTVAATNVALIGTVGKTYDGSTAATLIPSNYEISGWQGSDGAVITQTTGTYDNANAGTGKLVSVDLTNQYTATGATVLANYNLPTAISGYVGVVSPRVVTVSNAARSTTYDGVTSYASLALGTSVSASSATTAPSGTGLVGSDALASVTQTPSGYTGAASGVAQGGSFLVTPSAAVLSTGNAANYSFSYGDSTHTVDKANATVTANSGTLTYNGANQTVAGFTASGLVGADTAAVLTGVSATRTEKNAGTYATTASGSDGNYHLSFVDGSMLIDKVNATVTANSGTLTYNGVNQTVTGFSAGGLVGADTAAVLTGVSATRTEKNAGTYATTASGSDGNYNLSFVPGSMLINKAALTATGNSAAVTYNGANQSVSGFTVSGLQGSDTVADLLLVSAAGASGQNAGSYTNAVTAGTQANYDVSTVAGTLRIDKANATVTASSGTLTYNGVNQTVTGFSASGLVGGEAAAVLTGVSASRTEKNAGTYATTASGSDGNYNLSFVPGSMLINKAALTATGNSAAVTYNGANQSVSGFTVSGLQGSDTVADLLLVSAAGASGQNAGSYTNAVTAGTQANYDVSTVAGTLRVDKANATVTANSGTLTYNGVNQTVTGFSASGLVGGEAAAVLTGVSASRTEKNAGTYATTASGSDGNYNLSFVAGSMLINKAALTATGNSAAVTYNGANQSVSGFTVAGLQGTDTVADLLLVSAAGASGQNAGSYTNAVTAGTQANYDVSTVAGTLRIDKANATVTANSGTLVYNGANQTVTGITASGLVGAETTAVLTSVIASRTEKNAGTYATTASGSDSNYNLSFVPGSMLINKAALTATGNSAAVTYNGANQSVTGFTVAGLQGIDTVAVLSTVAAAGATAKNTGNYPNTVSTGTEANYNVSTVDGSLAIAKANATVTANSGTLTYNGVNQIVTGFSAGGLVGADTAAVLTGVSASRTEKNAGTYATTASGSDDNYNLSFVAGSMLINKAALTATGNSAAVTYNGANQSVTGFTVAGLQGIDTVAVLSTVAAGGATAKNTGNYPNTMSAGTEANYNVSTVEGSLAIAKANATVTANSGTLTYNGVNQTVTGFTASGLVGAETTAVLTNVNASLTEKNAGTYATTASGSDSNYNLSFVPGSMLINKAALTVSALHDAKTYDAAAYAGGSGASYRGWVNNETAAVLSGTLAYSGSSQGARNAGTYVITPGGLSSGNYTVSFVDAALTVNPAALALTAQTNTKSFDGNASALALPVVSGLRGADTVRNLSEAYADSNPGNGKALNVKGDYLVQDGNGGANYAVTLVADTSGVIRALPVAVLPPATAATNTTNYTPPQLQITSTAVASGSPSGNTATGGSSPGVSVNTINQAALQLPGLVAVLVPGGTATAGTGLVIALPEAVMAPALQAALTVSVTTADNQPLPAWIRYEPSTQSLVTGAVPAGAFPISVLVRVGEQVTVFQISESQASAK